MVLSRVVLFTRPAHIASTFACEAIRQPLPGFLSKGMFKSLAVRNYAIEVSG
jgi:hypothetical protein